MMERVVKQQQQQSQNNNDNHEHQDEQNSNSNNHNQQQQEEELLNKPQHPHDDKDGELLLDAGKFSVITKPSESEHDSFWKISCVGKSSAHDHHRSSSSSCLYSAEFFDRRDLLSSQQNNLHHHKNENKLHHNNNDAALVEDEHKQMDENFRRQKRVGDAIKRKQRPIPDDALVEDNLFERRISVHKSEDQEMDHLFMIDAPNSKTGVTSFSVDKKDSSFSWSFPSSSSSSTSSNNNKKDDFEDVDVVMTSDLNSRDNVHHLIRSKDFTSTFKFNNIERIKFFGLGNRGSSMELPSDGRPVRVKNLDINHYQLDSHITLYGAVPLVYAAVELKKSSSSSKNSNKNNKNRRKVTYIGIFYLNGATMSVSAKNDQHEIDFKSEGGGVRVFLLPGPTPASILKQYYRLTGVPNFPPLFSLGYHQSRWTYKDQKDVLNVHKQFLDHKMPCDVIWLDIDHTNGLRYFTWDTHKFPEPESMQYTLFDEAGRRLVTISDPHIKHDTGYHVFSQGSSGNHFVTHGDGRPFYGHCWPGQSAWIDFLKEDTRTWYSSLYRYGSYHGSTLYLHTWNDMNEPSVFSGPDLTFPMDDVHHFNGEVSHRDVHNVYGFYQSMATFKGLYERDLHLDGPIPPRRPFALTRSFFAGSHRYAAVWTGDNQGKWDHLQKAIEMSLMLSMSGIPLVGADIGGFFDNTEHHLLATWFAAAVTNPFFRGHAHQDVERREPYLIRDQGGRVERALQLRYRVVSYLYTCFARLHFFSESVMRPLFFDRLMGTSASFMFPGHSDDNEEESDESDLHFNANDAQYFFWGNALLWRPFVDQHELQNLHSNPTINICNSKKRNNRLWLLLLLEKEV